MDTVKNFFCRDVQEVKKKCRRDKKSSDLFCLLLSTGLEPMTLALSEPRATNCARRANSQVMELYQVCSMSGNFFFSPNVGLEPTTTRLRVLRSADWANRAFTCYITRCVINISCYHCTTDCRKRVAPEFSPSHIFSISPRSFCTRNVTCGTNPLSGRYKEKWKSGNSGMPRFVQSAGWFIFNRIKKGESRR